MPQPILKIEETMDASFCRNAARVADLVAHSDHLLESADAVIDRVSLESQVIALLIRKSVTHCEEAKRLFESLTKAAVSDPDFGPGEV